MTLGVNRSQITDDDRSFSEQLIFHGRSLNLTQTRPVGDWSFGQGIRFAHEDSFFWGLKSVGFHPLGLNHPVTLKKKLRADLKPQAFSSSTLKRFPQLENWKWSIVTCDQTVMKKDWTKINAWSNNTLLDSENLQEEDCTLKSLWGWGGWKFIDQIKYWSVRLEENVFWVASPEPLPSIESKFMKQMNELELILHPLMQENDGRIQAINKLLRACFPHSKIYGLNVIIESKDDLNKYSIQCDSLGEDTFGLCFPTSLLQEDLGMIQTVINKIKGESC